MAPRGHAALVSVGALALMAALAGCGDDETPPAPTLGGDPTTASPAPTDDTASSGAPQRFDDKGADVLRGRVNADDEAEEEVADAWFAYWEVRLPAFNTARLDADALGEVARDQAVTEVVDYVAYLAEKGYHTEGDLKIGISEIEVHGDIAGVQACMQNKSVDRDAGGAAVEDVTPYYNHVGTLERVGGTWLVTGKETIGSQRCRA